eukprot:jgi/Undpi1/10241/HiC_scaffold_28.g12694.m1
MLYCSKDSDEISHDGFGHERPLLLKTIGSDSGPRGPRNTSWMPMDGFQSTTVAAAGTDRERDFFTTTGLDGSAARKAVLASRRSTPPFSINPRTDSAMTPQMTDTAGPTADSLVHLTSWRHRNRDAATVAATATKLRGGKGSTAGRDVTTRFGRRLFGSRSSSNDHGDPETSNGGSVPPGTGGMGRWGWGGGGGGGGRGGDGEEGDGRGDFVALGAAQQGMMATRRSRYSSSYGGGGARRPTYVRRRRRGSSGYGSGNMVTATKVLTALNVIVFMFQTRYPAITSAGWKLAPAITQQGQWYRLLTPVVLHGSLAHLLINSMSFNSVGPVVESVLGKKKFLAVYALAGIAGNVLSCVVNPRTPAVGASGAIFGMVGAWGAFCLMNESVLGRATSQRALQSVAQTVMLNVAYGMSSSQIDNMGHLGVRARGGICTNLTSAL